MARLALNKNSLQKERDKLRLLQRLLPSLDLKRRQLLLELNRAKDSLAQGQVEVELVSTRMVEQLPMLANREIDVSGLVHIDTIELVEENVVGVKLPILENITFTVQDYSRLAKPAWVDVLVDRLKEMVELRMRLEVAEQRVRQLERAVRRITQRVNLFDKILIPTAKNNIQRIQIYLGDAERAAVVRSKLAKSRHRREPGVSGFEEPMP